jgi:hypothetical protein
MQVIRDGLQGLQEGTAFDLVVVGAGGAGLACALFGAIAGARVLLVERTALVGGTTAWSAGTTWVPGTAHAARVNPDDTLEAARRYLDAAVGDASQPALREAFLSAGPRAVDVAERLGGMSWRPYPKHPDYLSELDGSTLAGRALEPEPFDGRLLGPLFSLLRPPIPEFTVLGGMMVDRTDISHLLGMRRSWTSLRHAMGLLMRHARDRLSHPRGTRLVMGNALVGRLLHALSRFDGVVLALNAEVDSIDKQGDARTEAQTCVRNDAQAGARADPQACAHQLVLRSGAVRRGVTAERGVVLASGGFNRDPALRAQWLPGIPADWCPAAPGHTGQALGLARDLGARFQEARPSAAFWAPVSMRRRADGSTAVFPHFVLDRAKPGMVTVDARGRRFVNESTSYHRFGLAMQAAHRDAPTIPAFLVCDARALRQYGLGMVRPGGRGLQPFLDDGYLVRGATLQDLAQQLGIAAAGLQATVDRMGELARDGRDPDFGRGETAYQRNLGDATWGGLNPNLGALTEAPFYAIRLVPGDIGAAMGLATDADARLLGDGDRPLPGLYAVGNDMQSIMGGAYPGPGITVGPGLVFAFRAARHALGHPDVLGSDSVRS